MPAQDIAHIVSEVANRFRHIRESDTHGRPEWMKQWGFGSDYQDHKGAADLFHWLDWYRPVDCLLHYLPQDRLKPLAEESERWMRRILGPLAEYPYAHIDEYNALDFTFQNFYPVPERMRPKRILDFGPGFGRQLNLWSSVPDIVYVGLEAIELPYSLQSYWYSHFGLPVHDYLEDTSGFRVTNAPGVYHLPTWRSDLLPDKFFDLVICVQVLQEIPAPLVRYVVELFKRCVKPGGAVYIRDHALATQMVHSLDSGELLRESGFVLEFCPYVIDHIYWRHDLRADIHGIPRIWRRVDGGYPVYERESGHSRPLRTMREAIANVDARYHGLGHWLFRKARARWKR